MTGVRAPAVERFWAKVQIGRPDECWTWTAAKTRKGYGNFRTTETRLAHRYSYELAYGEIPNGLHVCHHCDNPSCVNPRHLFISNNWGNVQDRDEKNRVAHGSKHRAAKLTEFDVAFIRRSGRTVTNLSAMFGVSAATISEIRSGKSWRRA